LIAQAVNARKTALNSFQSNPDIVAEIAGMKIPHSSDFMYHSRGLTIALYRAIQINYLVGRLNDVG
jgi:hypothetical protein